MPIKGFLKTTTMPDTHLELVNLHIDIGAPSVSVIVSIWEDDTKTNLIQTMSYYIDQNDPRWTGVLAFLQAQKPVWMDAIEKYLLQRPEYFDAIQEALP
jgi:hypothetical protein